eukprot:Gb_19604 [translate_table: standard]
MSVNYSALDGKSSSKGQVITCKGEPLVIEEIQVAPPQPSEVRIKIVCTTLCHSDLSFWKENNLAVFPCILGHEAVGTVESVGEDVKNLQEGDLVTPVFRGECTQCVECKSQRSNECLDRPIKKFGVMISDNTCRFSINGQTVYHFLNVSSFTQYTVVDINHVVKVNPMIAPDKACLLSCGVTTWLGAVWKVAKVEEGSTVAIFGLGTIGLAVAEGARIKGASRIIGVDVKPGKFELGKKFGVTDMVNPNDHEKPVHEVIREMTGGGVDYSFECVGMASLMREAFESSRNGWGTTVVLGLETKNKDLMIDTRGILSGRSIKGALLGGMKPKSDLPALVEMYMKKELQLDEFITHQVSFWEINKAFHLMEEGKSLRTSDCKDLYIVITMHIL